MFRADAVDELEECGGDHLICERVALLAAGKEHWDESALGGKTLVGNGWKKRRGTYMAHDSLTPSWK